MGVYAMKPVAMKKPTHCFEFKNELGGNHEHRKEIEAM